MGENSKIEWTHHTHNPWRGCTKVSAGCANCYAEKLSHRNPGTLGIWGDNGTRVVASESYWREPLKWNREAEKAGERRRVFCASLADVFEDREELHGPRERLFRLIEDTPWLVRLLLTKRPENIEPLHRIAMGYSIGEHGVLPNLWLGTSVEDQKAADERIPHLLRCPAAVRFLSCEPLLGPVDLRSWTFTHRCAMCNWTGLECDSCPDCGSDDVGSRYDFLWGQSWEEAERRHAKKAAGPLDWIIVGGESGPSARPMHPDWARSLRDQCVAAGVPFFFKQWGEFSADDKLSGVGPGQKFPATSQMVCVAGNNYHWEEFRALQTGDLWMHRVGKTRAGRLLDGREWNGMPQTTLALLPPAATEARG